MTIEISELFGDEEIREAVTDRLGDKYIIVEEESHIPKSKFETIRQEKKEVQEQLDERDNQLETLKKQAKDHDNLKATVEEMQEKNEKLKEEYETKMKETKLDMAIENELIKEKARNPDAVKALLNKDAISLDEDGNVVGLPEQLDNLKEEEDYLFGETGLKGEDPNGNGQTTAVNEDNPFSDEEFNLTEQGKLIREDPDKARKLIKKAGKDPANYDL